MINFGLVCSHSLLTHRSFVCFAGKHGGARSYKFSAEQELFIENFVLSLYKRNPLRCLEEYVTALNECGFDVSRSYVHRIFARWGWSAKKARHKEVCIFLWCASL